MKHQHIELSPGAVATVSPDVKPEVLRALKRVAKLVRQQHRFLKGCKCGMRKNDGTPWGYDLQRWTNKQTWRAVGGYPDLESVEKAARRHHVVLIRCNGCGSEIVREYPKEGWNRL